MPGVTELHARISLSHLPQCLCKWDQFLFHRKVRKSCSVEADWPPLPQSNWSILVARYLFTSEMELSTGLWVIRCGPQDANTQRQSCGALCSHGKPTVSHQIHLPTGPGAPVWCAAGDFWKLEMQPKSSCVFLGNADMYRGAGLPNEKTSYWDVRTTEKNPQVLPVMKFVEQTVRILNKAHKPMKSSGHCRWRSVFPHCYKPYACQQWIQTWAGCYFGTLSTFWKWHRSQSLKFPKSLVKNPS